MDPNAGASPHYQVNNSLSYIFYELEKISNMQLRMMETMNSFQTFTRNEIDYLKSKVGTLESQVEDVSRFVGAPVMPGTM